MKTNCKKSLALICSLAIFSSVLPTKVSAVADYAPVDSSVVVIDDEKRIAISKKLCEIFDDSNAETATLYTVSDKQGIDITDKFKTVAKHYIYTAHVS